MIRPSDAECGLLRVRHAPEGSGQIIAEKFHFFELGWLAQRVQTAPTRGWRSFYREKSPLYPGRRSFYVVIDTLFRGKGVLTRRESIAIPGRR